MEIVFLFIIIPALIALLGGFFVYRITRKKLLANENRNATAISIGVFVATSLIIFACIVAVILNNLSFRR